MSEKEPASETASDGFSSPTPPPTGPPPSAAAAPPRRRGVAFAIGGLLVGGILGFAASSLPGEGKPETRTVEVERAPAVCIEALDLASEGFGYAAEFGDVTAEVFDAASRLDVAGMEAATVKMDPITQKVVALQDELGPASRECRAKA